jgi:hypothetical protein
LNSDCRPRPAAIRWLAGSLENVRYGGTFNCAVIKLKNVPEAEASETEVTGAMLRLTSKRADTDVLRYVWTIPPLPEKK